MPKSRQDPETKIKLPGVSIYHQLSDSELMEQLAVKLKDLNLNFLSDENWIFTSGMGPEYEKMQGKALQELCQRLASHTEINDYLDEVLELDKEIRQAISNTNELGNAEKLEKMQELLSRGTQLERRLPEIIIGEVRPKAAAPSVTAPTVSRRVTRSQTREALVKTQIPAAEASPSAKRESIDAPAKITASLTPAARTDEFKDKVDQFAKALNSYQAKIRRANKKPSSREKDEHRRLKFMNQWNEIAAKAKELQIESASVEATKANRFPQRRLKRILTAIDSGKIPRFITGQEKGEIFRARDELLLKQAQARKAQKDRKQLAKQLKDAIKVYKEAAKYYKKGKDEIKDQETIGVIIFHGGLINELAGLLRPAAKEEKDIEELLKEAHLIQLQEEYRLLREKLKNNVFALEDKMYLPASDKTGYRDIISEVKNYLSDFDKLTGLLRNLDNLAPGLMRAHAEDKDFHPKQFEMRKKIMGRLRKLESDQIILDKRDALPLEWVKKRNNLFEKIPPECEPLKQVFLQKVEQRYLDKLRGHFPNSVSLNDTIKLLKAKYPNAKPLEWLENLDSSFDKPIPFFEIASEIMQEKLKLQTKLQFDITFNALTVNPRLQEIYNKHFARLTKQIETIDPINFLAKPGLKLSEQDPNKFRQVNLSRCKELNDKSEKMFACFERAGILLDRISDLKNKAFELLAKTDDKDQLELLQIRIDNLNRMESDILSKLDPVFPKVFNPETFTSHLNYIDHALKIENFHLQRKEFILEIYQNSSTFVSMMQSGDEIEKIFLSYCEQEISALDTMFTKEVFDQMAKGFLSTEKYDDHIKNAKVRFEKAMELFRTVDLHVIINQKLLVKIEKSKSDIKAIQDPDLKKELSSLYSMLEIDAQLNNPFDLINIVLVSPGFDDLDLKEFNKTQVVNFQEIEIRLEQTTECVKIADELLSKLADLRLRLVAAPSDQNSQFKELHSAMIKKLEAEKIKILELVKNPALGYDAKIAQLEGINNRFDLDIAEKPEHLIWLMENANEYLQAIRSVLIHEFTNDTWDKSRNFYLERVNNHLKKSITSSSNPGSFKDDILTLYTQTTSLVVNTVDRLVKDIEKLLANANAQKWEYDALIAGFTKIYDPSHNKFKDEVQLLFDRSESEESKQDIQRLLTQCKKLHAALKKDELVENAEQTPINNSNLKSKKEILPPSSTFISKKPSLNTSRPLPATPIGLFSHEGFALFNKDLANLIQRMKKLSEYLDPSSNTKLSQDEIEKRIQDIHNLHINISANTSSLKRLLKLPDEIKKFKEISALMDSLQANLHEENGAAKIFKDTHQILLGEISSATAALEKIQEASAKVTPLPHLSNHLKT
jgi:hypothetical protein